VVSPACVARISLAATVTFLSVLDAEEIFRISVMILKRKLNILGVNFEKISKN
jgi:hypothetical protein